ncbi:MAG: hypothetical protein ACI4S4_02410 [Candidatus Ornithospirochaeta sp.]
MKKFISLLIVLLMTLSLLSASNVYFAFGDIGQHPDILTGFFPSYVYAGAGIKLPSLIDGNTTDMQVLIGEGYLQRLLWQDKDSGENRYEDTVSPWDKTSALKYNAWSNDLTLRFRQGFLESPVEGKDLFMLTLAANTKYERYYGASSFGPFSIKGTLDSVMGGDKYSGNIYPELQGDGTSFLGMELQVTLKMDAMKDTLHTNDGIWARIDLKYGPEILNSFSEGKADYITTTLNVVGAKTLWNMEEDGRSIFSLILIDRANASWTGGDAVPSFVQGPVSLGRKVRGFNTYTYNTEFTAVNNLDLRITGPGLGLEKLAPRINLFVDCGYGWGNVLNTVRSESNFLASTGVQIEFSFFDFIDLGYQINYLLVDKEKYTQPGKITTNFTFFLDF